MPPSVASLRPVEDFWAAFKHKVYEGGWEAHSLDQLRQRSRKLEKLLFPPFFVFFTL